jgi:hypothetical protein
MLLSADSWKNNELFRQEEEKGYFLKIYTSACEDSMQPTYIWIHLNHHKMLTMRKLFLLLCFVNSLTVLYAQNNDVAFTNRLNTYLKLNTDLNFDELMDYTHPNLFKLAPREQLVRLMKSAFDNEHARMSIDSIHIDLVSDDFIANGASYKRIDYSMKCKVLFKKMEIDDDDKERKMTEALLSGFPGGTVKYNRATKYFEVRAAAIMIAIKDSKNALWMFLGHQNNPEILEKLYPKEVIQQFKL